MSSDEGLDQAIAEFLDAADGGRTLDRDDFIARHPGHTESLRLFFKDLDQVTRLFQPMRSLPDLAEPPFAPRPFGRYELLEVIDQGGMGIVYKARHPDLSGPVALKVIRWGPLATPEDLQRFRFEVRNVASLDHPNIVPILAFDQHDGQPYFTMKFVEGGDLRKHLDRFHGDTKKAARLMAKVARAVHHAHQRGILHRDLKPGNILLDQAGEPQLADWGIAKRLDGGDNLTTTGEGVGTAAYMAPEQAEGGKRRLTTAADIYSLGVVLYEILTGRLPFQGETPLATLELKSKSDPEPPPVDRDLQAVCIKCLERAPENRYKSAKELADDLDRWLDEKPVMARHGAGAARLMRAVRRYSDARIKRFLEESRRRELRQELLYISSAVADRVLMKLKDWSSAILEAANDPDLPGKVMRIDPQALQDFLDHLRQTFDDPARGFAETGEKSPVENWFLFDNRGVMITSSPQVPVVGQDFSRREWYRGAVEHAGKRGLDSVHVSRVCLSLVTKNLCKFTLSAPVYRGKEAEAPVIGVLGASFTTDSNLGISQLNDERHKVVVVGRWDPDSYGGYSPEDHLVLVHPAYRRGEEAVKVGTPCLQGFGPKPLKGELRTPEPGDVGVLDERYEDPLGDKDESYRGPWWAGIAPVGNTPFAAIVQRRPDALIEPVAGIAVGLLVDLTGHTRSVSESYAQGVQAYADWFNSQGHGINGKKVRLLRVDYANRLSGARQAYARFKTVDRVVAIQGWGTGDSEALADQVTQDEVPFLSGSYSAHLTDPKKTPYNFIIAADYSSQLRAGLNYLRGVWKEARKPRIAFVYPNDAFGMSPIPAGRQHARELGFEMVGEEHVALDAAEATAQILALKKVKPDFTWIGGTTPSTAVILKDARTLGLRTRFLANVWGHDEHLVLRAGEAAEGLFGLQSSVLFVDDVPGMQAIREVTRGESKLTHYVRGWVSMMVLCEALRRAEKKSDLTGPGIKRALETLRDFDTQGLTPPITFTADDHRPAMAVGIYEYSGGRALYRATVNVERRPDWLGI